MSRLLLEDYGKEKRGGNKEMKFYNLIFSFPIFLLFFFVALYSDNTFLSASIFSLGLIVFMFDELTTKKEETVE